MFGTSYHFTCDDNDLLYILMQRSSYAHAVRGVIETLYTKEIIAEFQTIKEFLPKKCDKILDIGCGSGGIDLFLYKYYTIDDIGVALRGKYKGDIQGSPAAVESGPSLYLADKGGIYRQFDWTLLDKNCTHCSNLQVTANFLKNNNVPENKIHTFDLSETQFPNPDSIDLVISLISMGFHYPLDMYIDYIMNALSEDGTLVTDLKHDSPEYNLLESKFSFIKHADSSSPTGRRVVCQGPRR